MNDKFDNLFNQNQFIRNNKLHFMFTETNSVNQYFLAHFRNIQHSNKQKGMHVVFIDRSRRRKWIFLATRVIIKCLFIQKKNHTLNKVK